MIDSQHRDEMVKRLEEMVAQVKIENERETAQFTSFLADFKTNVQSLYKGFNRSADVDDSINQLDYLIDDVCRCRGNPMKVGSRWVYLLLCEGALEHHNKSINPQENNDSKERMVALHLGVTNFLQQYEDEIHTVIEKTITSKASCFSSFMPIINQWWKQVNLQARVTMAQ